MKIIEDTKNYKMLQILVLLTQIRIVLALSEFTKTSFLSREFIISQTWMVRNQNVKEKSGDCSAWEFYCC